MNREIKKPRGIVRANAVRSQGGYEPADGAGDLGNQCLGRFERLTEWELCVPVSMAT